MISILMFPVVVSLALISTVCSAQIVGIFGDVHGDAKTMDLTLSAMKAKGVTHIIGMGDYAEGNVQELTEILGKITPSTGVPKKNIFLIPGNWETKGLIDRSVALETMKQFGQTLVYDHNEYAFIEIAGKAIAAIHVPARVTPVGMLPERERIELDTVLKRGLIRGQIPTTEGREILFEIIAHTHKRGAFVDPHTNKWVVNAGVLNPERKSESEVPSFALYDFKKNSMDFFAPDIQRPLQSIDLNKLEIDPKIVTEISLCQQLINKMSMW